MSSYSKWDRDAYIERAGGPEEAERRRKTLMARQTGYRLAEERKRHHLTQAQLAQAMGVTPGRVSQIERGELATIDAVARYVEALGGRLDLVASFGDHTLTVTTTEAAHPRQYSLSVPAATNWTPGHSTAASSRQSEFVNTRKRPPPPEAKGSPHGRSAGHRPDAQRRARPGWSTSRRLGWMRAADICATSA